MVIYNIATTPRVQKILGKDNWIPRSVINIQSKINGEDKFVNEETMSVDDVIQLMKKTSIVCCLMLIENLLVKK